MMGLMTGSTGFVKPVGIGLEHVVITAKEVF